MIREYRNTDTESILECWEEASAIAHPFLEVAFIEQERKNIREIYLPNTETWVYDEKSRVVGFISMLGHEVGAIFIRPECQGRSIGTILMDHVSDMHQMLEVEVFEKNAIGRSFYEKYGFRQVKRYIHAETGQSMLRMKYVK
ncbi:MAG: N-acetyltransferase [Bacteroidetes bacterium]|nr:MAG: N-acetyltransferase [Bacteroidota bacterium]